MGAVAKPRAIAEIGESGATAEMPIYNRSTQRTVERKLRRIARKRRRGFWKFPPAAS